MALIGPVPSRLFFYHLLPLRHLYFVRSGSRLALQYDPVLFANRASVALFFSGSFFRFCLPAPYRYDTGTGC